VCPFAGTYKVPGHVTIIDATNLALNPDHAAAASVSLSPLTSIHVAELLNRDHRSACREPVRDVQVALQVAARTKQRHPSLCVARAQCTCLLGGNMLAAAVAP
jgi:hypothetical protein